jgi:PAS domain S-box-containing protein
MGTQKAKPKKPVNDQIIMETLSMSDWKTVFDQSPDHIVLLDKDLCILYTNHPSPGLSLQDLIGVPLYTFVEKDRQEDIRKKLARTLRTGRPCSYETEFRTPDGNITYYQSETVPWKVNNKKIGLILTAHDITIQKKTRLELERKTDFLDATIDNSSFPMWVADPQGFMVRSNGALRKKLGFKDAQLIGKYNALKDESLKKQGLLPQVKAVFMDFKTAHFTTHWESSQIRHVDFPSTRDIWIEVTMFPILDGQKNLLNVVCQWLDITEQKENQRSILENEQKYQSFIEDTPLLIDRFLPDGTILFTNKAYANFFGKNPEDLPGKNLFDLIPEEAQAATRSHFAALSKSNPFDTSENFAIRNDGEKRWIRWSNRALFDRDGKVTSFQTFGLDITDQKHADEQLRQSEEKYRLIAEFSEECIWQLDREDKIIYASPAVEKVFGYTPQEVLGVEYHAFFHDSEVEHINRSLNNAVIDQNGYQLHEFTGKRKDGTLFPLEISVTRVHQEGVPVRVQGIARDISERAAAEKERKALLHSLSDAQRIAHVGSWDWYLITNTETWSDELFRIFGRDPQLGVPAVAEYESQYHPDDLERVREALNWQTGADKFTIEFRITRHDDQAQRFLLMRGELLHDDDKHLIHFFGTVMDITDQKISEVALRESRRELETLIGNLPGMAYRCDSDEKWTMRYLSQGCLDLTGYPPEDFIENKKISYHEIIHPDDRDFVDKKVQKALEKKQPFELTYRINTAGGAQKWVWEKGTGVLFPNGELISLEGFITDITERVQAEKALKKNMLILDTTQQIGKIGGWVWDVPTQVMTWTPETYHIHDIDPGDIQLDFQPSFDASLPCYPLEDRKKISALFDACINQGTPYEYECTFTSTKGRQLWIRTAGHAVHENGRITSIIGYIMDITSQKQVALALEASETRLRELVTHMRSGVVMYQAVDDGNDFIIKDLNQAGERIGEIKKEEVVGKSVLFVYPGVVETGLFKKFQDVYRTGKPGYLLAEFYQDNKQSLWIENYIYKLPSGEIIAIFDDITERKTAQNKLEESESRFRAFMDNSPAVAYIKNDQLQHVYGNQGALNSVDRTSEEFLGTKMGDIHPSEESKITEEADRFVLEKNTGITIEGIRTLPNGEKIWQRDIKFPLRGTNGEKLVGGIALDLTERKKAEETIRENEERFRAFMDNFPGTAYIKNEKLEHIYGNKTALEFAGTPFEAYVGSKTDAIYPKKLARELEALDRTVLTEQRVVYSEGYYPKPNGDLRWKRDIKFPLAGPNGEKLIGGIALDMNEQKKAQEAIRESEERFRALFSAMNSGLSLFEVICDDKGNPINLRFLQVNPTYEQQNNLKAKDVIGKTILEVYPGFDPEWIVYYGNVALTREPFEKEVFNQPENKYFNYKAFSPQKGQVASISTDIHQQKLDQIALEKRKDELERFNRLSVGRELKMVELKKEINQLCRDLGEKPRYRTDFK